MAPTEVAARTVSGNLQIPNYLSQRSKFAGVDLRLVLLGALGPDEAAHTRLVCQCGQCFSQLLAARKLSETGGLRPCHGYAQRHPILVERDVDQVQPVPGNFLNAHPIDPTDAVRRIDHRVAFAKRVRFPWSGLGSCCFKGSRYHRLRDQYRSHPALPSGLQLGRSRRPDIGTMRRDTVALILTAPCADSGWRHLCSRWLACR